MRTVEGHAEAASLLLLAEQAQRDEDYVKARAWYQRALELAPYNWAAKLNLAVVSIRLTDLSAALKLLTGLREEAQKHATDEGWTGVDHTAAYNEALARWHLAMLSEEVDAGELGRALAIARDLSITLLDKWKAISHQPLLGRLEGPTLTLLAGLIVEGNVQRVFPHRRAAAMGKRGRAELLLRLRHEAWTCEGTAVELVRFAMKKHDDDPICHYNAAVFYARGLNAAIATLGLEAVRDERFTSVHDDAYDQLRRALALDRGHLDWARRDPLLAPLRDLDRARFDQSLARAAVR